MSPAAYIAAARLRAGAPVWPLAIASPFDFVARSSATPPGTQRPSTACRGSLSDVRTAAEAAPAPQPVGVLVEQGPMNSPATRRFRHPEEAPCEADCAWNGNL